LKYELTKIISVLEEYEKNEQTPLSHHFDVYEALLCLAKEIYHLHTSIRTLDEEMNPDHYV